MHKRVLPSDVAKLCEARRVLEKHREMLADMYCDQYITETIKTVDELAFDLRKISQLPTE
jgi:hypothetical protein